MRLSFSDAVVEAVQMAVIEAIYERYIKRLSHIQFLDWGSCDGEFAMHYGPAHIVWADKNYDIGSVDYCLEHWREYEGEINESQLAIVHDSLVELREFLAKKSAA